MPDQFGNPTTEERAALDRIVDSIRRGQSPHTIPAYPPTADAGDKIVKGLFKGGAGLLTGLAQTASKSLLSAASGYLEAAPEWLVGPAAKKNQQKLEEFVRTTPMESEWRNWILEAPKSEGAAKVRDHFVNAITDASGFRQSVTEHYNNYISGIDANVIVNTGFSEHANPATKQMLYREDGQLKLLNAAGINPTAFTRAVGRSMADIVFEGAEALKEDDFEKIGEIIGAAGLGSYLFSTVGPLAYARKVALGDRYKPNLGPAKAAVTKADLERLHIGGMNQRNLAAQLELNPEYIEKALNVPLRELPESRELIGAIGNMNDRLLAAALDYGYENKLPINQALSAVLEQGRPAGIEIAIEAARLGIPEEIVAGKYAQDIVDISAMNTANATFLGSNLNVYSDLAEGYAALRARQGDPRQVVKDRLRNLIDKYKQDFDGAASPALVGIKSSADIVAKGALGAKVTSPVTTVRDTISQIGMGAVDIFEKAVADGVLSGVKGAQKTNLLKSGTGAQLLHPDIYNSVAIDTIDGYMRTFSPSQRTVVKQIIEELPVKAQQKLGSLHADAMVPTVAAGVGRSLAIAGRSAIEGSKAMTKKGSVLAGADLVINDAVVRTATSLRSVLETWQQNSFFGAKLWDEIQRDGKYDSFEGYLEDLRRPDHDPRLDKMWDAAADFTQERSMRLNPDINSPFGNSMSKLLDIYSEHPLLTLVFPDYPRFLYNKYDWMMRRRPTQFFSLFDSKFRDRLLRADIDMEAFDAAASRLGLKEGTPGYDKALAKARSEGQRAAAEDLGRATTGAIQLYTAMNLQNSEYAGAKYYELDFGTKEEPRINKDVYDSLVDNGIIQEPVNPNDRIVLDLRAYDPLLVPYLAFSRFANVYRKTGDLKAAQSHFTASEVADLFLGLRNLDNSGFALSKTLQTMTDPNTKTDLTGDAIQFLDEEILSPYTTIFRLLEVPVSLAGMDEGSEQLDPFSQDWGRTQQNLRPIAQLFGKEIALSARASISGGGVEEKNKLFRNLTGFNLTEKSQLEQRITGAGLNIRELMIGSAPTAQEAQVRTKMMADILSTRMPNGQVLSDVIADYDVNAEIAGITAGTSRDELIAFRRDTISGIFELLRAEIADPARLQAFQEQPLNEIERMKVGKTETERYYLDILKEMTLRKITPRKGLPSPGN